MMSSVRAVLAQYLNTVRSFTLEVANVDSGVLAVDRPDLLLQEPRAWFQREAEWIEVLLKGLETIRRYVDYVNRWIAHIRGVLQNLRVTKTEFTEIIASANRTAAILRTKTLDQEYLRWVLQDISEEIDRLFNATRDILDEAPRLVNATEQIKGPFMVKVRVIAQTWTSRNLSELSQRLIELLKEASACSSHSETLQRIGNYIEMIVGILTSTPLFVDDVDTQRPAAQVFQQQSRSIEKLIEYSQDFEEFVRLRSIAYQRFLDHVTALIQAVLPSVEAVTPWINHFVSDLSQKAEDLLPEEIPVDTLPLAFLQAQDAQNDWVEISKKLIPLRQRAFSLNEIIQSPVIAKFLTADQRRREITKTRAPMMLEVYQALQEAIRNLPSLT